MLVNSQGAAFAIATAISVTTVIVVLSHPPGAGSSGSNTEVRTSVSADGGVLVDAQGAPRLLPDSGSSALPTDPMLGDVWALKYTQNKGIDAVSAWLTSTGSKKVTVAVVDSGMDINHEDLKDNIWTNPGETPGNGIDDDGNGFVDDVHGWDFQANDNDPTGGPAEVHATHVAGIIGAKGNNGVGVTGINWEVSIIPLRFMDEKTGFTSDAIEALQYAIKMGAQVSCNSWGGAGYQTEMSDLLDAADKAGMLFVASAGNGGKDNDATSRYPTSYTHEIVIGVAASDRDDGVPSFTNYGVTSIDLAAPGVNIMSTLPAGSYGLMFGSSMAAPQVAGVCALLKSANPGITHREIKKCVLDGVDALPAWKGKTLSGGRLNAKKAMEYAFQLSNVQVERMEISDALGNADGKANPGEEVSIKVKLRNVGYLSARQVSVSMSIVSGAGGASLVQKSADYGDIDPVTSKDAASGEFRLRISESLSSTVDILLRFELLDADGHRSTQDLKVPTGLPITVDGTVVDAGTGTIVPSATVRVQGPYSLSVASDASGRYSFVAIGGLYTVIVSADGYEAQTTKDVLISESNRTISFSLQRVKAAIEVSAVQPRSTVSTVSTAADSPQQSPQQNSSPAPEAAAEQAASPGAGGGGGGCFIGFFR